MSIEQLNFGQMSLPFPITSAAIAQADAFAAGLVGSQAQQIRQNTLAVWVVNEYLKLMAVSTDLKAGDSWHPVARLGLDTADLVTAEGRLECRSIVGTLDADLENASGNESESWLEQSCIVPPEVWFDRAGYVFVQLDEANQKAAILGFLPTVETERVELKQVQPIEHLFDHLYALRSTPAHDSNPLMDTVVKVAQQGIQKTTQLGKWLQDQVEEGWQSVDNLFGLTPSYAFRSRPSTVSKTSDQTPQVTLVRRGKEIAFGNWQNPEEICQVALVMGVKSGLECTLIELGLYPVLPQTQLPEGLMVEILDDQENVFLPPETIGSEELLEFEFGGESGEAFSVVLQWQGFKARENFVI